MNRGAENSHGTQYPDLLNILLQEMMLSVSMEISHNNSGNTEVLEAYMIQLKDRTGKNLTIRITR